MRAARRRVARAPHPRRAAADFVIVALLYRFTTGINAEAIVLLGSVAAFFAWEMSSAPLELVASLQATTIAIFSGSKVPQIVKAFQAKSTGQLDLFMVTLMTGGSLARVFTTFQTVDDKVCAARSPAHAGALCKRLIAIAPQFYLLSYIVGTALNAVMLGQVLIYGNAEGAAAKTRKSPPRKAKKTE